MRDDLKKLQADLAKALRRLPSGVNVVVAVEDMRGVGELFTYITCDPRTAMKISECASAWFADNGGAEFTPLTTPRLH